MFHHRSQMMSKHVRFLHTKTTFEQCCCQSSTICLLLFSYKGSNATWYMYFGLQLDATLTRCVNAKGYDLPDHHRQHIPLTHYQLLITFPVVILSWEIWSIKFPQHPSTDKIYHINDVQNDSLNLANSTYSSSFNSIWILAVLKHSRAYKDSSRTHWTLLPLEFPVLLHQTLYDMSPLSCS